MNTQLFNFILMTKNKWNKSYNCPWETAKFSHWKYDSCPCYDATSNCSFLLWIHELNLSDSSRLKFWTRLYPIKAGYNCLLNLLRLSEKSKLEWKRKYRVADELKSRVDFSDSKQELSPRHCPSDWTVTHYSKFHVYFSILKEISRTWFSTRKYQIENSKIW